MMNDTIPAVWTPTAAGTWRPRCRSWRCRSCNTAARFALPCCWYTERKRTPAISVRRRTASWPAITRNCSLSPVQTTPTFTIGWTSFRLKSWKRSLRNIWNKTFLLRATAALGKLAVCRRVFQETMSRQRRRREISFYIPAISLSYSLAPICGVIRGWVTLRDFLLMN